MKTATRTIATVLKNFFCKQRTATLRALRSRKRLPDYHADMGPMAEALEPVLFALFVRGGKRAARKIVEILNKGIAKGMSALSRKIGRGVVARAAQAAKKLAADLVRTLADTTREAIRAAKEKLNDLLNSGADFVSSFREILPGVTVMFGRERVDIITETETVRADREGGLAAAEASEKVKTKTWRAAGQNPCPKCLALDGMTVKLGEPFVVLPGGGPYSIIRVAPYHINCKCEILYS